LAIKSYLALRYESGHPEDAAALAENAINYPPQAGIIMDAIQGSFLTLRWRKQDSNPRSLSIIREPMAG
jgi:hypothetical protein